MVELEVSNGDEPEEGKFRLNVWENSIARIIKQHKILLRKREAPVLGVFKISLDNVLSKRNYSKPTKHSRDYAVSPKIFSSSDLMINCLAFEQQRLLSFCC